MPELFRIFYEFNARSTLLTLEKMIGDRKYIVCVSSDSFL